jgi:hypothetical protein
MSELLQAYCHPFFGQGDDMAALENAMSLPRSATIVKQASFSSSAEGK